MKRILLIFLLVVSGSSLLYAQQPLIDTINVGKIINIIQSERYNFQDMGDTSGKFISLVGNAQVKQEKTHFNADSIVLNQKANIMEAFGNIHINDADSVHTYAQYVKYYGKEKKAFLNNKVKLTDGKGVLTTDNLEYDVNTKEGIFLNGGKLVNGKTVLTSKEGYYYGNTRDVIFKKKVLLNGPDYKIITDTLLYNLNTDIVTFVCPTSIKTGKRTIKTNQGWYNLKNKQAWFGNRPIIDDSSYTLVADSIHFNDSTGMGNLRGKVIYSSKDSVGGFDLTAGFLDINKKKNTLLATDTPILIVKQEKDSIYITADTLYGAPLDVLTKTTPVPVLRDTTYKVSKDSSANRYFRGYHHVKIFSDSMQAVGDSMFYSLKDSVFRLFTNPIVWTNDNQIMGDTIYMYTQNKKPEKMRVIENATAINKLTEKYYNQVSGNVINAFFKNGEIFHIYTKGSPADNVYYAQDDNKKFIGVNKSTSDVINVYLANNKAEKVTFINNLTGTMYPMGQVNHDDLKVRHFRWDESQKPKNKFFKP